jgi:hypothetical protein
MSGITAINVLPPAAASGHNKTRAQAVAKGAKSTVPSPPAGGTTVSPSGAAQDAALHSHGAKQTASKGRKRARKSSNGTQSKRQKTSEITKTMSATKSAVNQQASKIDTQVNAPSHDLSSTEIEAASAASRAKLSAFRHHTIDHAGPKEQETTSANTYRPVPVYAPPTSMDSVQTAQPRTTMQSVQQASSSGCTIYESPVSQLHGNSAVDVARPWLDTVAKNSTATANTRVLRPRKEKISTNEKQGTQIQTPPISDIGDQAMPRPSGKTVATTKPRKSPVKGQTVCRTKSDEEFAVLDDDLETELIELTDNIEQSAEAVRTPPARDRKQNMRDVHEHEDYGGALFSVDEKALLGM